MEMNFKNNEIEFEKELSKLDEFVINFCKILEEFGLDYTIVSGYVSIIFGRSRGTEDVDMIIEKIEYDDFIKLDKKIKDSDFWCINTDDTKKMFELVSKGHGLRYAEKGNAIPNFEIKFPQDKYDKRAIEERISLRINKKLIFISPIELQIAYKFYLGSDKDYEDAVHLIEIFREFLDIEKMRKISKELKVLEKVDNYVNS